MQNVSWMHDLDTQTYFNKPSQNLFWRKLFSFSFFLFNLSLQVTSFTVVKYQTQRTCFTVSVIVVQFENVFAILQLFYYLDFVAHFNIIFFATICVFIVVVLAVIWLILIVFALVAFFYRNWFKCKLTIIGFALY